MPGLSSDEFSRVAEEAKKAEVKAYFDTLRAAHTSKDKLNRITSESKNEDERDAAYQLLDLITSNEAAGLTGEQVYLEHDNAEDFHQR